MTPTQMAETAFRRSFDRAPAHFSRAPGRVNLIGEHTDYNDGFVLPVAIDFATVVAAERAENSTVHVVAADYGGDADSFSVDDPIAPHASSHWSNYVRGVVSGLLQRGYKVGGANLAISGNVPQGAGLSSSASLEVAVAQTFNALFDLGVPPTEIALIGQEAEHRFVGTRCGIMDQLVSVSARQEHALLIDCRSLETKPIPMPDGLSILIVNSNVVRGLVDSEYNSRRQQCEGAARELRINALRDICFDDLLDRLDELPPKVARRARHVVSENQRTLDAADALARSDINALSRLMAASHASMRDDFEITVPAIDCIVDILGTVIGDRGGVRMTGGGFGGCVVALLSSELIPDARGALANAYERRTGLRETTFVCQAAEGAVSGYQ